MAKIFRFSGYFLDNDEYPYKKDDFEEALKCELKSSSYYFNFQQLHIEESEEFELDGEDKDNCDLDLLERHFSKETETQFDRPIPKTGQWIQVEEKLPEDGVTVLTCDNHENIHVMKHYNFCEYPFDIGPEHERYYMPKAWMPLPEPYKESEK